MILWIFVEMAKVTVVKYVDVNFPWNLIRPNFWRFARGRFRFSNIVWRRLRPQSRTPVWFALAVHTISNTVYAVMKRFVVRTRTNGGQWLLRFKRNNAEKHRLRLQNRTDRRERVLLRVRIAREPIRYCNACTFMFINDCSFKYAIRVILTVSCT